MSDEVAKELRYVGAQMEQVLSEVKAVHELVAAQPTLADFHRLEGDVAELKSDMKTVKTAVGDLSDDLAELRQQSGYTWPGHVTRRAA